MIGTPPITTNPLPPEFIEFLIRRTSEIRAEFHHPPLQPEDNTEQIHVAGRAYLDDSDSE